MPCEDKRKGFILGFKYHARFLPAHSPMQFGLAVEAGSACPAIALAGVSNGWIDSPPNRTPFRRAGVSPASPVAETLDLGFGRLMEPALHSHRAPLNLNVLDR